MHPLPNSNTYWVAPGRLMAGEYPGNTNDRVARERLQEYINCGVTFFLDLTQYGESGLQPYDHILRDLADDAGVKIDYVRRPIVDGSVPDVPHMERILDTIDEAIEDGHTVYAHCWGGVGRTGTTVATYLIRHGKTADEALEQLARWWSTVEKCDRHPRSPENDRQEHFVRSWKP